MIDLGSYFSKRIRIEVSDKDSVRVLVEVMIRLSLQ